MMHETDSPATVLADTIVSQVLDGVLLARAARPADQHANVADDAFAGALIGQLDFGDQLIALLAPFAGRSPKAAAALKSVAPGLGEAVALIGVQLGAVLARVFRELDDLGRGELVNELAEAFGAPYAG